MMATMNSNGQNGRSLPDGWEWTTLGASTNPSQKRVNPQNYPDLPYIGMENVESHTMQLLGTVPAKEMKSTADSFSADDVLYGRLRPYLNKVYRPEFDGLCSTEFIIFRKVPHIRSKYLQYFLNSWDFMNFANSLNAGDRPRVKFEQLADYPFPLAPLPEQERVVSRIEELFSDLEAGVAALERVSAGLRRYKASVLKAACEGKLVNGKSGVGEGELPDAWTWSTVEELNPPNRKCAYGVLQPGDDKTDGVPFVRVGDINDGSIDTQNMKRIDPEIAAKYPRTKLQGGEVLITLVGAIGRTAVVPESLAGANTARAVGVIPVKDGVHAPWVEIWFRNSEKVIEMTSKAHEVARKTLNLEDVRSARGALPPLDEQQRIVAEVERRLSVVGGVESAVEVGLVRAGRLRQAVLRSAFEGKLL